MKNPIEPANGPILVGNEPPSSEVVFEILDPLLIGPKSTLELPESLIMQRGSPQMH